MGVIIGAVVGAVVVVAGELLAFVCVRMRHGKYSCGTLHAAAPSGSY